MTRPSTRKSSLAGRHLAEPRQEDTGIRDSGPLEDAPPARTTRRSSATRPSEPPAGTARLGTYWQRDTFNAAKSAYLADLDTLPDSPGSFARWIALAIDTYAAMSTERRAKAQRDAAPESRAGGRASRAFHLPTRSIEAMEHAIVADRKAGHVRTRSEFVSVAVRLAIAAARERYGRDLPPAPARLPNRPVRDA